MRVRRARLVLRPTESPNEGTSLADLDPEILALGERLQEVLGADEGWKIMLCDRAKRGGTRCKSRWCPYCSWIEKKARTLEGERLLAEAALDCGTTTAHLTLTVGARTVEAGRRVIVEGLRALREEDRRWREIVLLEVIALEVERCVGERASGSRFNVHAHVGVALMVDDVTTIAALRRRWGTRWRRIVSGRGSLDLREHRRRRNWRGHGTGLVAYSVKLKRGRAWLNVEQVTDDGEVTRLTNDDIGEIHFGLKGRPIRWTCGPLSRRGRGPLKRRPLNSI